jgi:hypothetical protein
MNINKYEMEVHVNGKAIKRFSHEGKLFIEGHHGSEYAIRVQNNTSRRVLAILSVDGINVINGTEAKEASTGYVIAAYGAITVKGFRESNDHVGTFKFSTREKSYTKTTATGSMQDCGVIGCMIVEEKIKPYIVPPIPMWDLEWRPKETCYKFGSIVPYIGDLTQNMCYTCCSNTGENMQSSVTYSANTIGHKGSSGVADRASVRAPGVSTKAIDSTMRSCAEPKDFDLGTSWGQRVLDKVEYVDFERGEIAETIVIFYATKEVLLSRGVPLVVKKAISYPNAFPGQFCHPPTNYQG